MDLPIILFSIGLLLTAILAYLFAVKYLYQEFEHSLSLSLILFINVLVCSVGVLMMLVMEIVHAETPKIRGYMWVYIIANLTYSALFLVPTVLLVRAVNSLKFKRSSHLFKGSILIFYYILVVISLYKESSSQEQDKGAKTTSKNHETLIQFLIGVVSVNN